ncbi:hypothetical protein C8R47DRAFT_1189957 [Mycena vitilis]|nr:hypothetical protein C8R47DRAFT_1189957 [Mycena vitilis]
MYMRYLYIAAPGLLHHSVAELTDAISRHAAVELKNKQRMTAESRRKLRGRGAALRLRMNEFQSKQSAGDPSIFRDTKLSAPRDCQNVSQLQPEIALKVMCVAQRSSRNGGERARRKWDRAGHEGDSNPDTSMALGRHRLGPEERPESQMRFQAGRGPNTDGVAVQHQEKWTRPARPATATNTTRGLIVLVSGRYRHLEVVAGGMELRE